MRRWWQVHDSSKMRFCVCAILCSCTLTGAVEPSALLLRISETSEAQTLVADARTAREKNLTDKAGRNHFHALMANPQAADALPELCSVLRPETNTPDHGGLTPFALGVRNNQGRFFRKLFQCARPDYWGSPKEYDPYHVPEYATEAITSVFRHDQLPERREIGALQTMIRQGGDVDAVYAPEETVLAAALESADAETALEILLPLNPDPELIGAERLNTGMQRHRRLRKYVGEHRHIAGLPGNSESLEWIVETMQHHPHKILESSLAAKARVLKILSSVTPSLFSQALNVGSEDPYRDAALKVLGSLRSNTELMKLLFAMESGKVVPMSKSICETATASGRSVVRYLEEDEALMALQDISKAFDDVNQCHFAWPEHAPESGTWAGW